VIVGAGPAGAGLALRLARAGAAVTLVEAGSRLDRQFRGEALMPHGLEALGAMGLLPLPPSIPQRPLRGWRFVLEGRELFGLREPLEPGSALACTLISQPALLQHWLQELRALPLANVLLGQRVVGLLRTHGRVCGVRLADGRALPARLVVAADGRGSRLRQLAELPLRRQGSPIDLLWFRLEGHDPSPLEGWFTTVIGSTGLFSAFDSAHGGVQLGWVVDRRDAGGGGRAATGAAEAEGWAELFAAQSPPRLAAWLRAAAADLQPPVPLSVEVGQAERWWRPGLLLVGDAAHPMSPVRAQGINLALRDACVAAEELLAVLRRPQEEGQAGELDRALARIEQRRRPESETLQRLQAQEARRGNLLRRQGWLRRALAHASPWLGPLLAQRWRGDQAPLRLGVTPLRSGSNDGLNPHGSPQPCSAPHRSSSAATAGAPAPGRGDGDRPPC
jgi:2-polyprenyl-6-methoxyphenol hydroxylase-like FAD-dependent oxidoreductase